MNIRTACARIGRAIGTIAENPSESTELLTENLFQVPITVDGKLIERFKRVDL